jgi:coxsackievirus/adenovirus receptor
MRCAGVEEGSGCEPCLWRRNYQPTCGKDGLTYENLPLLECTGVEKDHDGPCEDPDFTDAMLTSTECQKACPPIFEPVCGMNNKSYANKCRMECDGVELKHEGRCPIQTI